MGPPTLRLKFVVVAGVGSETKLRRALGIPGDQLVLIVVEKKVEGIARIHVDHDEVSVVHGEFAEAHIAVAERHVVASLFGGKAGTLRGAEGENDFVAANVNRSDFSLYAGCGEDLLCIENEIVFFDGDALDFFGVDETADIDAEQIQKTFHGQVSGFDVVGANPDTTVGFGGESSGGFKRDVGFLRELAFHDELIVVALEAEVLDGSVGGRKDIFVQDLGERVAADGNFGGGENEGEGILVVENDGGSGLGGSERPLKLGDVDGDRIGVVIKDVLHGELDRVGIGGCGGLTYRGERLEQRSEEEQPEAQ